MFPGLEAVGEPHDYALRWTFDSTKTAGASAGDPTVASADPSEPLLLSEALTEDITSNRPLPRMRSIVLTRDHWALSMSAKAR